MTVHDDIALGLNVKQGGSEAVRAKVQETARLLQIDALLERLPGQLSGGQRVAGRVLVSEHPGESTLVHVDCPAFPDGLVARFDGARAYREGESVELALPPLACHVFDADGQARERRFRCEEGAHPANR
ncbi:TOBE domain-containing protein [Spiribacter halobius]|uniref:Transport-associated OB type 2 domain-containing protein n=1 Tax=Sediminicurvatus halobius TaxID=2182432 RepID=A0A2U2MZM4_9GAMM|nr:TOBE domain-containing protein [Spiribacter halobius]PWG62320.1 hypothetical protein DEM34_12655 [Spiribacter halobius]UEX79759.1 TOBE domain-containing protein [Spiribacter halobius]